MSKQGYCKYCGKYTNLVKSHIIPRSFYLDYKNQKYIAINAENKTQTQRQCGAYDKEILCEDCDNKIFGEFDKEAHRVLIEKYENYCVEKNSECTLYHLKENDFNFKKLRKFFISILWRASVSKLPEFSNINLGKYENIAENIIKDKETNEELFNVIIFKIPKNKLTDKVVNLHKIKFCKSIAYKIIMSGFIIITVIKNNIPKFINSQLHSKFFMTSSNLYIYESEDVYQDELELLTNFVERWKN